MTANEFRLGNYILKDNKPVKISVENVLALYHNLQKLQPILLTEEILFKSGFEKDIFHAPALKHHTWHYLLTEQNKNIWLLWSNEYEDLHIRIIYHVHQLQNLHFALTGEELNITL